MADNVIILGAGFSYDAGIPLLGGFVERMLEFALRKKHNDKPLDRGDQEIFEDAIKVRNELDNYHGRAVFDDRNIEDILSILSFNVLGGKRADKDKLNKINRAIARTIELSCSVTHPGAPQSGNARVIETGPDTYRNFWRNIFACMKAGTQLPTIITFNYDLVLERALLQLLIGTRYDNYKNPLPFKSFEIKYYHDRIPTLAYKAAYVNYTGPDFKTSTGTILSMLKDKPSADHCDIEILKLHGSLNFPKPKVRFDEASYNFANALDDPQILPPISNKMSGNTSDDIWRIALQRLREAKNVVIVGYSLPRTDIYMQYFLKAAFGPNMDLNKVFVFDPALYSGSDENKDMRKRYQECFASQLHKRIYFNLDGAPIGQPEHYSTTVQFVQVLNDEPSRILF
jgi:SIR2-like domain